MSLGSQRWFTTRWRIPRVDGMTVLAQALGDHVRRGALVFNQQDSQGCPSIGCTALDRKAYELVTNSPRWVRETGSGYLTRPFHFGELLARVRALTTNVPGRATAILDVNGAPLAAHWNGFQYRATTLTALSQPNFATVNESGNTWRVLLQRESSSAGDHIILVAGPRDQLERQQRLLSWLLLVLTPLILMVTTGPAAPFDVPVTHSGDFQDGVAVRHESASFAACQRAESASRQGTGTTAGEAPGKLLPEIDRTFRSETDRRFRCFSIRLWTCDGSGRPDITFPADRAS
jgi:hypothetical protein